MKFAAADPAIIAHRGASGDAPENTIAAFRLAWEQGADGIEGDFRLTADGQIICMHDKGSERTAGRELLVADSTLAELQALDVGAWKGRRFRGERAPSLEQVLAELPRDKAFFLEIKSGIEVMPALRRVLGAALEHDPGLQERVTIISFQAEVVRACRRRWPGVKANWLVAFDQDEGSGEWTPVLGEVIDSLRASAASGLGVEAEPEAISPELVRAVRDAGLEFHCWTVNDGDKARRFRDRGVESITTDFPARIRASLEGPDEAGGGAERPERPPASS